MYWAYSFKHKKMMKLNKTQNGEISDYLRYQGLTNNMSFENEAPQWNDPAIKYIKKSILESTTYSKPRIPRLSFNQNLEQTMNKHFLYPLCNSPKRKEYYKEMICNYRDELKKQIDQKRNDRLRQNFIDKLKAETTIL